MQIINISVNKSYINHYKIFNGIIFDNTAKIYVEMLIYVILCYFLHLY